MNGGSGSVEGFFNALIIPKQVRAVAKPSPTERIQTDINN